MTTVLQRPEGRSPASGDPAILPGLGLAALGAGLAFGLGQLVDVASPLVVAVVLGALWANLRGVSGRERAGLEFAARMLLRAGIVLLGLRLSLADVSSLGGPGLAVVAVTVVATFFGTQALGRRLGLDRDLSLLVATGYSICGASAIAAMAPNTDADDDHVAASVGLVTLFGSLAIVTLPAVGAALGLAPATLGSWIGASTHDVAQVIAAASTAGAAAVNAAIVVKLTRVALLAPLVAGVSIHRRVRHDGDDGTRPPLLPAFLVGFVLAVLTRTSGLVPDAVLDIGRLAETGLLAMAMFGLGAGVRVSRLRRLGWRPLALGAVAWVVVAGVSLLGVALIGA